MLELREKLKHFSFTVQINTEGSVQTHTCACEHEVSFLQCVDSLSPCPGETLSRSWLAWFVLRESCYVVPADTQQMSGEHTPGSPLLLNGTMRVCLYVCERERVARQWKRSEGEAERENVSMRVCLSVCALPPICVHACAGVCWHAFHSLTKPLPAPRSVGWAILVD
jgi:hypothetical protein